MLIKGPFEADIAKVSDAERRSDLHELHYLWRISRRSADETVSVGPPSALWSVSPSICFTAA